MFKGKGIRASELRPFSVEDPDGTGRLGPTAAQRRIQAIQQRLEHRRKRTVDPSPSRTKRESPSRRETRPRGDTPSPRPAEGRDEARPGRRPRTPQAPSTASVAPSAERASRLRPRTESKKKRKGCGCLGCLPLLVVLGLVFSILPQLIEFASQQLNQQMVRQTGLEAPAQILAVEETGFSFGNEAFYEVTLAIHLPNGKIAQSTIKQLFSNTAARHLVLGSWTHVRVSPDDPSVAVIISVGNDAPPAVPRRTQRL